MLTIALALVIGYLLGSLPFGYLVARAKGVNIFEVGSRNPGATNVRRVLGRGPGNLVFFLDALKGALAVAAPLTWYKVAADSSSTSDVRIAPDATPAMVAGLVGAL